MSFLQSVGTETRTLLHTGSLEEEETYQISPQSTSGRCVSFATQMEAVRGKERLIGLVGAIDVLKRNTGSKRPEKTQKRTYNFRERDLSRHERLYHHSEVVITI